MRQVGVVLHPARPVRRALEALQDWTASHGVKLAPIDAEDAQSPGAPSEELGAGDLVVAIGGDGTVLTALHAAAKTRTPVLGVACGSLGALSIVSEAEMPAALDRIAAGDWWPRHLPALAAAMADADVVRAVNDLVLVRRGGTQLLVEVSVGGDLYARLAGDGVIVATPLGSSAYTMAAGGPVLVEGIGGLVCTPLAMHGGCAPPVVIPPHSEVVLDVDSGYGGFELEFDGHHVDSVAKRFAVSLQDGYATLVGLGDPDSGLPRLRRRGLITDSPRVLARDARTHPGVEAPPVRPFRTISTGTTTS
jgi:NAD+ kinase